MKKDYIKPALLLLFILVGLYIARYTTMYDYFNRDFLQTYIQGFGIYGPLIFILIYLTASLFFFPGTPITILSGILFGNILGTSYTVVGATIGASLAFFISRFLGKDFVDKILKQKMKGLNEYDKKLEENGLLTMLFLRLIPLFPFNGLNFAMGLTKIKFRHFLIGTFFGIIPGSFVIANIGSSSNDLASPQFYFFIALFLLMAALPTIYKKWKKT